MSGWNLIYPATSKSVTTTGIVAWGPSPVKDRSSMFLVGVDDRTNSNNLTVTITGGIITADTNAVYFFHDGLKYPDGSTAVNTYTFSNDVKLLWTPMTFPVMAVTATKAVGAENVIFYIYAYRV